MYRVGINAFGKISADRTCSRFLRVCRAHQIAIFEDRVVAFKRLDHHWARNHEINQILEEGTLFVHAIEGLSLAA